MKLSQRSRLVVSVFVAMSVVGVMAVVACAPAAPSSQSGGGGSGSEEPEAAPSFTPTPTPTAICVTYSVASGGTKVACEVEGPRNLPQHLRYQYSHYMEQKAEREEQLSRGVRAEPLEVPQVFLRIYVNKAEAVPRLVEFLEANGAYVTYSGTKPSRGYAGGAKANRVDIELLPAIAAMDGVGLIEEVMLVRNPYDDLRVDLTVVMESAEKAGPLLELLESIGDDVDSYKKSTDGSGHVVFIIRGLRAGYMENIDVMDGLESMTGEKTGRRSIVPPSSSLTVPRGIGEKENPTEAPTLTPTPHPDCVTLTLPDGSTGVSCPPPGPENVEGNLRRHYNRVMATQEAQAERRSVVEPVYIDVVVDTDSVAAMHVVAEFLQIHEDAGKIILDPEPSFYGPAGLVAKHVNMELIPEIAAIEGVLRVGKESVGVPLSSQGQLAPNPAVLARMDVDDWHQAGVTGDGVEVVVVDADFRDFSL